MTVAQIYKNPLVDVATSASGLCPKNTPPTLFAGAQVVTWLFRLLSKSTPSELLDAAGSIMVHKTF